HGADAADAARDAGDLGVVAPAHHGLEEARSLRHLPLALLDHAVGHVDHDVAVTLHAGQVVDAYASLGGHDVASNDVASRSMAVNMSALSAARSCEKPACSTSTFCRAGTLGLSTKPRQASHG